MRRLHRVFTEVQSHETLNDITVCVGRSSGIVGSVVRTRVFSDDILRTGINPINLRCQLSVNSCGDSLQLADHFTMDQLLSYVFGSVYFHCIGNGSDIGGSINSHLVGKLYLGGNVGGVDLIVFESVAPGADSRVVSVACVGVGD
jgi:hypothetical protein